MPVAILQIELPSSNLPYLFAAFAVSWAAFFIYVFFMTRRYEEMRREIRVLRQTVERPEASANE